MLAQHLIHCQVSSVAGTLFNLKTQCSTVGFLSEGKDVHIMGWACAACLLKVKLCQDCFRSHNIPSLLQASYHLALYNQLLRVRFLSRPPLNSNSSSIRLPTTTNPHTYVQLLFCPYVQRLPIQSPQKSTQR
jgi:hypothetical protein